MSWTKLFSNPTDPYSHELKLEEVAERELRKAGWNPDGGLLKGEGFYKYVTGGILYATDEDGESPKATRPVLVCLHTLDEDGDWVEGDCETMSLRAVLKL